MADPARESPALYETKDALLTAVSHEVRTPLTKALGAVQLLDARLEELDDEQRRRFVRTACENLETLDLLLGDLIDLDRLWRDVVEPRRRTTDMGELISGVVTRVELDGRPVGRGSLRSSGRRCSVPSGSDRRRPLTRLARGWG